MRVSVMQMSPGADKAANIDQASRLIAAAIDADRPDIVSLPEIWTCLGGNRATKHDQAEALPAYGSNEPGGAAYEFLRGVARSQRIHVHGGSIGEKGGEKLFNTTVVLPGIGDVATLEALSVLAGDEELVTRIVVTGTRTVDGEHLVDLDVGLRNADGEEKVVGQATALVAGPH